MKVLLTGANGQLGRCICDRIPHSWELVATERNKLDITNFIEVEHFIAQHQPDVIINAAAYTAVDKAESQADLAKQVNTLAPQNLAIIAKKNNIKLIHISTDYVFDGRQRSPYLETDATNPINVYGLTKREGEITVLANNANAVIIRTSWVFSEYGNNFVKTMLKLADTKNELAIINDQIGCPTYAGDMANAIIQIVNKPVHGGIYHYCGQQAVTWFEFSLKIFEIAEKLNQLPKKPTINAISSIEYPTAAKRPNYSILNMDKIGALGIAGSNWQKALDKMILSILAK